MYILFKLILLFGKKKILISLIKVDFHIVTHKTI